jgi:AraC-like DNA-binding protein
MPDDEAVGRMAARHLQRPGWTRMAVYERDTSWWQARCRGWRAEAPDAPVVPLPADEGAGLAWMTGLPDGAALFASHDHVALHLARLGHQAGRQVGRDLRILGVDDQMDCLMTTPAISSIALPMRALGRLAVSTMAALMAGRPVPPRQVVAPLGVMVRGSSDPLSQVAPWIRDLALDLRALVATGRRPDLRRLIVAQGRHRSTVNRAWRDAMGCSVMDYVQDVRCELARIRLADGAGDPEAVARSLGFASARTLLRLLADR